MKSLLNKFCTPPTAHQSYFLSFEGIEGAGKTSQIQLLKEKFQKEGFNVLVFREPGGTNFGEKLRKVVLEQTDQLHPLAEACLFASSRCQLLEEQVLPQLLQPQTLVILDRYLDSSLVYQGIGRGLTLEGILHLHSLPPLNFIPHLTFYLKISLDTSLHRLQLRGQKKDYFESSQKSFFSKLLLGYDRVQEIFPQRFMTIDAEKNSPEVFDQIQQVWQKFRHDRS